VVRPVALRRRKYASQRQGDNGRGKEEFYNLHLFDFKGRELGLAFEGNQASFILLGLMGGGKDW
jgi:hypothetical protein